MMDTGVVSQSNLEAMRAAAGPGKDAQLAEILRSNNIRIMPDEQPAAGMRSAVYRPGEGDAGMTRVQALEEYEDTGRQFKGKSPMQLYQDQSPATLTRIVYASIHDTLITLNKWYTIGESNPSLRRERALS